MKIFFHNDFDGRCGAAIIKWKTLMVQDDDKFIELDYKDRVKVEDIQKNEIILIIDFSFKPEVMAKVLEKTEEIYWFDHHKTAFEYDYGIKLDGIRDDKFAGCELVWKYFLEKEPIPKAVQLVGDYDIWAFRWGKLTEDFHTGLWLYDTSPKSSIWWELFGEVEIQVKGKREILIEAIAAKGKYCNLFRENFCRDYAKNFGFETEFEGYKAFVMGLSEFGSKAFGPLIKQYPLCINFEWDGNQWTIGLYSEMIDVGKIAKKYRGGGHTGAAGFVAKELPFKKI